MSGWAVVENLAALVLAVGLAGVVVRMVATEWALRRYRRRRPVIDQQHRVAVERARSQDRARLHVIDGPAPAEYGRPPYDFEAGR